MRNWRAVGLIIVVLWMVCVTLWAAHPMTLSVTVAKSPDGSDVTATVECDSPLSGNTSPTDTLPVLPAGQVMPRSPCEGPITSARALFVLDAFVAAGAVLALLLAGRHHHSHGGDDTAVEQSSPVRA